MKERKVILTIMVIVFVAIFLLAALGIFLAYKMGRVEGELSVIKCNSLQGQQVIHSQENIKTNAGMVNYCLEQAASLDEAARSYRADASRYAAQLQTEADEIRKRLVAK